MKKNIPVILIVVALIILGLTLAFSQKSQITPATPISSSPPVSADKHGLDASEMNKINVECTKLNGTVSKEQGKITCTCPQKNPEGKVESAYCLQDLISGFEEN